MRDIEHLLKKYQQQAQIQSKSKIIIINSELNCFRVFKLVVLSIKSKSQAASEKLTALSICWLYRFFGLFSFNLLSLSNSIPNSLAHNHSLSLSLSFSHLFQLHYCLTHFISVYPTSSAYKLSESENKIKKI